MGIVCKILQLLVRRNNMTYHRLPYEDVKVFCTKVFEKYGFSETESEEITDVLLDADLSGIESHGIQRLIRYHKEILDGYVDLDAKLEEAYVKNVSLFDTFDNKDKVKPQWQTYTAKAFRKVPEETKEWVKRQQNNQIPVPAPIIIHVTDGHPEEKERVEALAISDALSAAQDIKSIAVPDGNALLFNIHITDIAGKTLRFPSVSPNGNDKDAARLRFLFDASSEMTDMFVARANAFKLNAQSRSRFMVSNEHDRNILAKLIAFGSSVTSVGGEFVELPKY
jgi:hypothetical protein